MRDPTGLRLPGFLEIQLELDAVTVTHQAWSGCEWKAVPMLQKIRLSTLGEATLGEAVIAVKHENV